MLLKNKVIFLSGGTEGIGLECAKVYLRERARIVVVSNNKESISKAQLILSDREILFICADVAIKEEVGDAMSEALRSFGRLDVIHNNAGIAGPSKTVHETNEDEWHRLFDIDVKGIYNTTLYGKEALKISKGSILNTSSLVGEIGQETHAAYAATKGAVNALTKSMALDYASSGIRVNAVAPAGVWTPMLRTWSSQQLHPPSMENYLNNIHPLGYCPEGDVIADACLFLISEQARFITGCILPVSGGVELGYRIKYPINYNTVE
jgi:NAD(P)-dependent dehydrogenase (short-subunit alcohol dehydrogenase family)